MIRVQNLINQRVISDKCSVADRFFARLKGLIGKSHMEPGSGMLFPNCNNIHMWFMSIPIDVVFVKLEVDSSGKERRRVSSMHENVRPWRFLPLMDSRANETLELPVGTIRATELSVGDELCID